MKLRSGKLTTLLPFKACHECCLRLNYFCIRTANGETLCIDCFRAQGREGRAEYFEGLYFERDEFTLNNGSSSPNPMLAGKC